MEVPSTGRSNASHAGVDLTGSFVAPLFMAVQSTIHTGTIHTGAWGWTVAACGAAGISVVPVRVARLTGSGR